MKPFHSILFTVSFLLSLQVGILSAQDSSKVSGPAITVSEKVFDFGQVPADTVVSHVFVLKNIGSDSLRIQRIKSG